MKENVVKDKSYQFALQIIELYKYLVYTKKEYVLAKQILRCGTSIGANIEEAVGSQSRKDFIAKISIAYKEVRETDYWLRLLRDFQYINKDLYNKVNMQLNELLRIIGAIKKMTINSVNKTNS